MGEWRSLKVDLDYPVAGPNGLVQSLDFREPDAEALERIDTAQAASGTASVRFLIEMVRAVLVDHALEDVIPRLHRDDFEKVAEALAPFVRGPKPSAVRKP